MVRSHEWSMYARYAVQSRSASPLIAIGAALTRDGLSPNGASYGLFTAGLQVTRWWCRREMSVGVARVLGCDRGAWGVVGEGPAVPVGRGLGAAGPHPVTRPCASLRCPT